MKELMIVFQVPVVLGVGGGVPGLGGREASLSWLVHISFYNSSLLIQFPCNLVVSLCKLWLFVLFVRVSAKF